MAYKAVFNGNSLYHVNNLRWPAGTPGGRGGQFREGDGDGDGQTEYQDSLRRKSDSAAARERLDSYYKNVGKENYSSVSGTKKKIGSSFSTNPYVDKNGNLTEAGKRRYKAEIKANNQKPKDKRTKSDQDLLDPNKWVKDDLKNIKELASASKEISDQASRFIDSVFKTKPNERLDLSKMTDKELSDILNRERLERQYNDIFNTPQENKGKQYVKKVLEINSMVAGVAVSGLTIAWLIKNLAAPATVGVAAAL